MIQIATCTPNRKAEKQSAMFAGKVLWIEMLETLLDHFRNGREAKILVPVHGQRAMAVDGSVRTSADNGLTIALPYERNFRDIINLRETCQIIFSLNGQEYRLISRIRTVLGPSDLLVIPKPPAIALQEREFFRIDTRIQLDYYCLAADRSQQARNLDVKVNISGSGIRIPAPNDLHVGDLIAMVLHLEGKTLDRVDCLAQVVRFCNLPNGDQAVALHFTEIDNQDRDKIVAFCLAREREILRTKVRTRDLF
jgi:c-di-GMP-binding flagellar brake protein YcgR